MFPFYVSLSNMHLPNKREEKSSLYNFLNNILQVLTYAQQSRERSNYEQAALSERMQEYKRQVDRESRWSSSGSNESPNGDGIQAIGRSSHKMIEAVMQSAAKGKVHQCLSLYSLFPYHHYFSFFL